MSRAAAAPSVWVCSGMSELLAACVLTALTIQYAFKESKQEVLKHLLLRCFWGLIRRGEHQHNVQNSLPSEARNVRIRSEATFSSNVEVYHRLPMKFCSILIFLQFSAWDFTHWAWFLRIHFLLANRRRSGEQWFWFSALFQNCSLSVALAVTVEEVKEAVQSMLVTLPDI